MPRLSDEAKRYRTELTQHLWHMHGEYRNEDRLDLDLLEQLHSMMHTDKYACPPHEHKNTGPYSLGEIKLTFGKSYLKKLERAIRGDDR